MIGEYSRTYDAENQTKRTDARGVIAQYAYDELNRVTRKTYTEPGVPAEEKTPNVTYCYDGLTATETDGGCTGSRAASFYGRLSEMWSTASRTKYLAYDGLGRVLASWQKTDGWPYGFGTGAGDPGYQYNLADGLTMLKLPSGRVVSYGYNAVTGQVSEIGKSDGTKWADQFTYAPGGALSGMRLGNQVVESWHYNSRLQPITITAVKGRGLLGLTYDYGTTQNNGNVKSQMIDAAGTVFTQRYDVYDGVNRLQVAQEVDRDAAHGLVGWSEQSGYDARGNRWVAAQAGLPSPTADVPQDAAAILATNRISGVGYDDNGNATGIGVQVLKYDAENRHRESRWGGEPTKYVYDGEGRRVEKVTEKATGSVKTIYVYDGLGNLAAEYATSPEAANCGTCYVTVDHLGSTRLVTDGSGEVRERHDYLPFGGEVPVDRNGRASVAGYGASSSVRQRFTGKERDTETGLDYFGARYFSGAQGRFTSPDPLEVGGLGKSALFQSLIRNPQNWNRYQYGHNSPLVKTDFGGYLTVIIPGTNWKQKDWNNSAPFTARVAKTFGETPVLLWWSGGNSRRARTAGAHNLNLLVSGHKFASGERLNIVAHSHGGNVALEASKDLGHKIDILITMNTPVRDDYKAERSNIGFWVQGYSDDDWVQVHGGNSNGFCAGQGECGPAGRTFSGADMGSVKNFV